MPTSASEAASRFTPRDADEPLAIDARPMPAHAAIALLSVGPDPERPGRSRGRR